MSYDISLWDPGKHPPAPTSFEQAAEMFLSLDDVNDGVNPNFVEFAKRLWANHPDESTWLGNPVEQASRFQEAKFSLSLPMDKRVELTRMVVDAGIACGLVVFDDQLGVAFHPEGLIFPDEWQERWAQLKDELDTTLGDANPAQVCQQLGRVIFRRFVCTLGAATASALPVLEQCRDIHFLDRQMNPEGKVLDEWPNFLSLVVARMAANPGFEERVALYERHLAALNQTYRFALLKTIADRLRGGAP